MQFRFQGPTPQPFSNVLNDPAMAQPFSSLVDAPRYHLRSAAEESARFSSMQSSFYVFLTHISRHNTPLFRFIPTSGQSRQELGVENPSPSLTNAPRYQLRSAAEVPSRLSPKFSEASTSFSSRIFRHSTPVFEVAASSGTSHGESDVQDLSYNTAANETATPLQPRKARAPVRHLFSV